MSVAQRLTGAVAIVPAYNEGVRIFETVSSLRQVELVRAVVVVDDGSRDDTLRRATEAGAATVRISKNGGKGAAMQKGAAAVKKYPDADQLALLFVDADLCGTAANVAPLIPPVLAGEADLAIAVLPPQNDVGGGRGLVVNLARQGIHRATGWQATQPLSGMRCVTQEAFAAALPLAPGWGVETGMTIDVISAGFEVKEVPCELQHRVSGTDLAGQLHRAEQYRDVARALVSRRLRRAAPLSVLARLPKSTSGGANRVETLLPQCLRRR